MIYPLSGLAIFPVSWKPASACGVTSSISGCEGSLPSYGSVVNQVMSAVTIRAWVKFDPPDSEMNCGSESGEGTANVYASRENSPISTPATPPPIMALIDHSA